MRPALGCSFLACLLLLMALHGSSLAAGKLQEIKARDALVCGVLDSVTPFGFLDEATNSLQGFEVDLCRAVAESLNVRLKLHPLTIADRIPLLLQGAVDIVAATMTHSYEKDEFIDFSITYFMDHQRIMTPVASGAGTVADLAGKRVAAVLGSRAAENLARLQPEAVVETYPTAPQAFMALKRGEAAAITADAMTLLGLKHADENPDEWALGKETLSREPYALGLGENDSDFRDAVNKALAGLWLSGEYETLYDNWFGPQSPYHLPLTWKMTTWP